MYIYAQKACRYMSANWRRIETCQYVCMSELEMETYRIVCVCVCVCVCIYESKYGSESDSMQKVENQNNPNYMNLL